MEWKTCRIVSIQQIVDGVLEHANSNEMQRRIGRIAAFIVSYRGRPLLVRHGSKIAIEAANYFVDNLIRITF